MSTTFTLNTQRELTIIGYLRELARNSNLYNRDSSTLIRDFYILTLLYHGEEKFAKVNYDYFEITDNGLTVRNISIKDVRFPDHTIYLNQWLYTKYIKSATWEFIIHELGTNDYEMSFAVVARESGVKTGINGQRDGLFGKVFNNGVKDHNAIQWWERYSHDQYPFKKGDVVTLTLDLSQKQLSYKINRGPSISIHNNNYLDSEYKNKYKMAVQLKSPESTLELTNFVIVYKDDTNDHENLTLNSKL